jgi:hypothetical protein
MSLITTLNIQTLTKKSHNDICPKPKKLYKLYNVKQENLNEHRKKIRKQILKLLNYKYLLIERKNLNLKRNSNKFHKKSKNMSLTFV